MTTSRRLSPPRQSPSIKSATSTPNIRKMAAVAPPSTLSVHSPTHFRLGSESLSTLRDPRSESDLRAAARETSPHPDLNLEVAALSNKLISAINHQTHLDDALAGAREELRQVHERLKQSEARNFEYDRHIKAGEWVKREEVDERTSELFRKFSVEKRARELAEREKRAIESELADLSTKLFEEANQLVVKARKETEAAEARTEQVRSQLADTENLLASHQEQLVQLKAIMERSVTEQEEHDMSNISTAPSTPAIGQAAFDHHAPDTPQFGNIDRPDPAPALDFAHLIAPILRNDVPAFEDFRGLLEINRKMTSTPASRVSSGTYAGLSIPTIPSSISLQQTTSHSQTPSNSSVNTAATASQPHSPSQSANSTISAGTSSLYSPTLYPPLRETKFFKRALAEDIDPTMRLDSAPGLSFFARRSVTAAINDNTLVLEPLPSSSRKLITSCTLCGERRRGDQYSRTHRFKAGDESAQWYPLCSYCVGRLRSTCNYISFLRMLREGLWRCDGEKGEEKAWEESVKLRERMFWARIGGGVVPTTAVREDGLESRMASKRPSLDVGKMRSKQTGPDAVVEGPKSDPHTPPQSASSIDNSSPGADGRPISEDEEILNIRELPSTAPPLQASSATVSPTSVVHPMTGGSNTPTSSPPADTVTAEPLRQSLAASLRRISLRDSLRFGSKSRNTSVERTGGIVSPGIGSPRLGAVAEIRAVYESREKETGDEKSDEGQSKDQEKSIDEETKEGNSGEEKHLNEELKTNGEDAPGQAAAQEHERQTSDGLNISIPGGFS